MPREMNATSRRSSGSPGSKGTIIPLPRTSTHPVQLTVYLAENDPGSRTAISAALCSLGCRTVEFPTGLQAIEASVVDPPDVLLFNSRLPDTDGLQALSDVRQDSATSGIPVIILAPSIQRQEEQLLLEAGASAFLVKPLSIDRLRDALLAIATTWTK